MHEIIRWDSGEPQGAGTSVSPRLKHVRSNDEAKVATTTLRCLLSVDYQLKDLQWGAQALRYTGVTSLIRTRVPAPFLSSFF